MKHLHNIRLGAGKHAQHAMVIMRREDGTGHVRTVTARVFSKV
eukprot:CAMPEP_0172517876 /NCGR_PEP_ID=MMETSP1066-20121228/288610_1 /TAXON_ID=671091 /ORGANISM="Coscinodiscus wailesii, Strain CCMP2513" /LENGTH=42 /DNA_ID= /DNA_START= /DNA_END= /DNA_ORIENTATION=